MKVKAILLTLLLYLLALPLFWTQSTEALTQDNNTVTHTPTFAKTTLPEDVVSKFLENDIFNYDPEGECVEPSSVADNADDCVPTTGDQVTWIGDSYSVDAQSYIESALPGVDLGQGDGSESYIHCSKSMSRSTPDSNKDNCAQGGTSGLELAKSLSSSGNMRKNLVFALGTNDAIDASSAASYIDDLVSSVGSGTNIILTTARTEGNDDYSGLNSAIRDAANKYSNVTVADWANSSNYSSDYYKSDSEHPGDGDGYKNWVDTITSALPDDCNNAGMLSGDNAQEKIWNQLVAANIPGVSDNAAVLAGILGNIQAESNFNPFAYGDGGYYGLFQDYYKNDDSEVKKRIDAAIGEDSAKYFANEGADAPQDVIDKAIAATVDYFTEVIQGKATANYNETGFINNLDAPSTKNGAEGAASYAELFLVTFERAVGGNSAISDSGVSGVVDKMYGSGASKNYQGTDARRKYATEIYNTLGKSSQASRTTTVSLSGSAAIAKTSTSLSIINTMKDRGNTYYHPTFASLRGSLRFFSRYDPGYTGRDSSSSSSSSSNDDCNKLAELRQEIWNGASQEDKEYFMDVVAHEDYSVSGIEGYLNQIAAYSSKYGVITMGGGDGTLSKWLDTQCVNFRPVSSCRQSRHTITSEDQAMLDKVLGGSNNINYAIGNASEDVGAGKIVCIWDTSKGRCLNDAEVKDVSGGKYSSLSDAPAGIGCDGIIGNNAWNGSMECWGMEMGDGWNEKLGITDCGPEGSGSSSSSSGSSSSGGSGSSSNGSRLCVSGGRGSGSGDDCVETFSEEDFPNYYQGDPQWSNYQLSNGELLGGWACGATSYAEIITALTGQEVTPIDVVNMTASSPYWDTRGQGMVDNDKMVGEKYGLEVRGVETGNTADIISKIEQYTKEGWMIHLSGGKGSTGALATGTGHYVSILSYRENNGTKEVLVTSFNNVNGETRYGSNSWVSLDDLAGVGIWEDTPFSITRKTSKTNSNNSNSNNSNNSGSNKSSSSSLDPCATTSIDCDDIKNSNIGKNGLNEEQAALFLARYAANENGTTEKGTNGKYNDNHSRMQCTTLAQFFINNFTKQHIDYTGSSYLDGFNGELTSGGGSTPSGFSVFTWPGGSFGSHIGIVVGHNSDGTPITINANGRSTNYSFYGNSDYVKNFNADDWQSGNNSVLAVAHDSWGSSFDDTFGKLEVDTDKLINYLCTGQL